MSKAKGNQAKRSKLLKVGLPLAVVLAGLGLMYVFILTPPQIKRQSRPPRILTVEVMSVTPGTEDALISAMGTVTAAQEVTLESRVSGDVLDVGKGFDPGDRVTKSQMMVRLDPDDYRVAMNKAEAGLQKARASLDIEHGQQAIARAEVQLMNNVAKGKIKATELALRGPQLKQSLAELGEAQAAYDKAKLDLDRTTILAPFDALVIERNVSVGSHVQSQEAVGVIVATNEYWVEAAVPLDRLAAVPLGPENGAEVEIRSASGAGAWRGKALRVAGKLIENGRMAKIIIGVPNPVDSPTPLLLDDYVSVRIVGKPMKNVVKLPREALRDDGSVWVLKDGRLDIRQVETAWKQTESVLIAKGLEPGEKVIISDLAAPVQGMRLAEAGAAPTPNPAPQGQGGQK